MSGMTGRVKNLMPNLDFQLNLSIFDSSHFVNQHSTSQQAFQIPHTTFLTSYILKISNHKHPNSKNSTLQTFCIPNMPDLKYSISAISHTSNIPHSEHPSSRISHILIIPHPKHSAFHQKHIAWINLNRTEVFNQVYASLRVIQIKKF